MPRIAIYPGSFDPVTNGHLDVVRHAVHLCDKLVVSIGIHPGKKPLFSTDERLAMVREVFEPVAKKAGCQFDCSTYDNLTIVAARAKTHAPSIPLYLKVIIWPLVRPWASCDRKPLDCR